MSDAFTLPQSSPEAQGIPSAAILAFVDAADRHIQHLHSLILLRHGHVVAAGWWDPYTPTSPHMLFSLSKSFTSTAIGLLVAEGGPSIDTPVLDLFPDEAPARPSAYLQALRVRHLLSMSTGHAVDPTGAVFGQTTTTWTRAFLEQPLTFEPGTHFVYNTAATYMLSAIVQKITGQRLTDYLQPRLFQPLGISNPRWETSPQGIDIGGSGLNITTESIARFGQLYLQKGHWQGQQLIPAAWVEEATSAQVSNAPADNADWAQGYGYQFWRCRHGAYRGDGAFGQFCVVLPAQQTVLAITAGISAMQPVLDLVWTHLLPALNAAPLPEDQDAQQALATRLAHLQLPMPQGQPHSPLAAGISGKTFRIAANDDRIDALTFDFDQTGCQLTIHNDRGEQRLSCGFKAWTRGAVALERHEPWRVVASGAWTDTSTYVLRLWYDETPFCRTMTCRFAGDHLTVEQTVNVAFGSTERPRLQGTL